MRILHVAAGLLFALNASAVEPYEKVASLINEALPIWDFDHKLWYEVAELLEEPLKRAEPGAKYYASFLYNYGAAGFPQDQDLAMKLAAEAANAGFLQAMVAQAIGHEAGLYGKIDLSVAASWYEKAGKAGSRLAASRLRQAYSKGELGLAVDPDEAAKWAEIAAHCKEP